MKNIIVNYNEFHIKVLFATKERKKNYFLKAKKEQVIVKNKRILTNKQMIKENSLITSLLNFARFNTDSFI